MAANLGKLTDSAARLGRRPRVVLMCHAESELNRVAIAQWLASFTDLVGIVLINEPRTLLWRRLRSEYRRVGVLRLLDVFAFRLYYAVVVARRDKTWLARRIGELSRAYPEIGPATEILTTANPNSPATREFLRRLMPEIMIARCKHILRECVFSVPRAGTFVLHPGVCPEYRNAHGAFWALAKRDLDNVGLTLLKVDRGVDTGPVYGYYRCKFDEVSDSHIVIMTELVLQNLDAIQQRLMEVVSGAAGRIDTSGRRSGVWGQPWLTSYIRWKREAGQERNARIGT